MKEILTLIMLAVVGFCLGYITGRAIWPERVCTPAVYAPADLLTTDTLTIQYNYGRY